MSRRVVTVLTVVFVVLTVLVFAANEGHCSFCGPGWCVTSRDCFSGCQCLIPSGEMRGSCYSVR